MSISQSLQPELERETSHTRVTLERVPAALFGWKPHKKSQSMGALAGHLADILGFVKMILETDSLDLATLHRSAAQTVEEVLTRFDCNLAEARDSLQKATDQELKKEWLLLKDGAVVFKLPRTAVLRSMVFSHSIHHRAQLGVYLRLNDLPVPATYGPSADEH